MLKRYLFLLMAGTLFQFHSYGQYSVISSGSDVSGSGGAVSFSIGQSFGSFNQSSTGSVLEGVQQPYEISVVTGIVIIPSYQLSIFPNPSTNYVILNIKNMDVKDVTYKLFNMNGALIREMQVFQAETLILLESLSSSNYVLKVYRNTSEIETFKIIKQ